MALNAKNWTTAAGNKVWQRKCWAQDMPQENQTIKHGKDTPMNLRI